jgi:uncharacterized protein YerC
MPHISKQKIKEETNKIILSEFTKFVLKLKYQKSDIGFFEDFFTKTEQVMLAKRLAIIALLLKGMSPYAIHKNLKVSPSTVDRMKRKLVTKNFRGFEEQLKRFLGLPNSTNDLLFGFMPMLQNKGMWKRIQGWERPD